MFDRYEDVPGRHVDAADRATLRGVIGVPIQWRGSIIGVLRRVQPGRRAHVHTGRRRVAAAVRQTRRSRPGERANAQTSPRSGRGPHATAAERERLLREVYDTLNQGLVGVVGQLARAEDALATGSGDERGTAGHRRAPRGAQRAFADPPNDARVTGPGARRPRPAGRAGRRGRVGAAVGRLDARLVVAGQPTPLDAGSGARDPAHRAGGVDQHRPARGRDVGSIGHRLRVRWRLAVGSRRRQGVRPARPRDGCRVGSAADVGPRPRRRRVGRTRIRAGLGNQPAGAVPVRAAGAGDGGQAAARPGGGSSAADCGPG